MSASILLVLRLLLAASLYVFLGIALWTLFREFKRQTDFLTARQAPSLILRRSDDQEIYRFNKPEVSLGRDPACDCMIDDKTISARHAHFSFHHNQWWIEDLGSTNGTFLNQEPIHTPLVLAMGDEVRCGQIVLEVTIGELEKDPFHQDAQDG